MREAPVLSISLVAALLLAGCERSSERFLADSPPETSHAVVTRIELKTVDAFYEATGTVQSRRKVTISAKIAGDIATLRVKEGDNVRAGQLVAEIDDRDPSSRTRRADAGVREAQSALQEVEHGIRAGEAAQSAAASNLRLASSTLDRYVMLRERKSVSPHEFEEVETRKQAAQSEVDRTQASLEALYAKREQIQARIEQAQAEVETSAIGLGYAKVHSPIDGVVTTKFIEAGGQAAPGTPIIAIESRDYEIDAIVPESLAGSIRRGTRVDVGIPSLGLENATATVATIVPVVDSSTRSYVVKLDPGVPKNVRPESGMFVRVRLPIGKQQILAVPASAIVERGQLTGIFVVDDSNVIRLRLIRTGERRGDLVEVLSGLAPGDHAIFVRDPSVKDGARWKP